MARIGLFLSECCKCSNEIKGTTPAAKLYRNYRNWTRTNGQFPVSAKKFHGLMRDGHKLQRVDRDVSVYVNVVLVTQEYNEIAGA